jgi:EpsD family peptidyl-prolyl cis-trans isomerase
MTMKLKQGLSVPFLALAVALSVTGCDKKDEAKATQVAAKVNGDEITVHQLNFELEKLGNVDADQSKQAADKVLKGLVDQQLLAQAAIEEKLDRDPQVVQAMDEARRQVLAKAYVEHVTQNVPPPTDAEIKDYYAKNPALFSERRIYKLQELMIPVTPENAAEIKAKLAQAKNLGDFAQWLKSQNIPARGAESVKAAEQLPLELLPRLHALKDGQALTLSGNNRLTVLFLAGSQTQPISEDQAKPVIERYLVNAKKREMAEADLKKRRDAAKIEYLGEYAGAAEAAAKEPAPVAPAAATQAGAPPAAPMAPAAPSENQNAIDKGVQGLK